ncbi:putative E3 ubiquitin-protein ligase ARI2-like [Capsicum annuum]|nr:putative E3 ubiquitin-protein ligase ARI2-like [Capsicum annuum]
MTSSSSMLNNNSISINVSDDEPDEFANKLRARARRKRKKIGLRGGKTGTGFSHIVVKKLLKWWPVVVFLLAAGLLVFEASRIGGKPGKKLNLETGHGKIHDKVVEKKVPTNLNRLDPVTHVVHGVREPCLKLLPAEELEHLDFPMDKVPADPIKRVIYITEANPASIDDGMPFEQHSVESRFNLFTGNQTLKQRDEGFKVKGADASIHCGFYSEKGGFRISSEDRSYMESCKAVVSTCAFGGGDDLYQPIGMSESSLKKVCFVAFWDEITLASQEADGHKVGDDRYIGKWRIILVKNLPFTDQRLNGKIPKIQFLQLYNVAAKSHAKSHGLILWVLTKRSGFDASGPIYSIWVDSKSQLRRDPLGVLEALLWRSNSVLAISEHGARSSVYDEAKAVVKKNKATPEEVAVQLAQYRQDGLPEDKRFNGKKGRICHSLSDEMSLP